MLAVAGASAHAIALSAVVIGIGIAARRAGVLTSAGCKQLSALQVTFLEPALAISALSSLTSADLAAGSPLLLWAPIHCIMALAVGYLLLPASAHRGPLLLCTAFGNAGALPNALVPALLPASNASQGLLFVQVYLVTWRLLLWSVGPALLTSEQHKKTDGAASAAPARPSLRAMLLPPPSVGSLLGLALAFAPVAARKLFLGGPLAFLVAAAQQAGGAAAPIALITLGFALSGGSDDGKVSGDGKGGGSGGKGGGSGANAFTRTELAACVAIRLIIMPCLHIALISSGGSTATPPPPPEPAAFSWPLFASSARAPPAMPAGVGSRIDDPFALVLLLQAGMPSAVSVQAIFQRSGVDTRPLGELMAWQYVLAAPCIVAQVVAASALM